MAISKSDERDSESRVSLDIDHDAMHELSERFAALARDYFSQVSDFPVFPQTTGEALAREFDVAIPIEAASLEDILDDWQRIIAGSRHNGHPRFFGYVASPSTAAGAFADLLASTLNATVTSWRSAPAATQIEQTVVRWLGSLIGYDERAQGTLTSGGSMANLTALLIAQRAKSSQRTSQEGLWNAGAPMIIYASDQVHFSISKAADILGLGQQNVRLIPSDNQFRLDVRALRETIARDQKAGLKPFCVVGSAGTAASGAIDPLHEVAEVARETALWFHIDGAYGAPAAMIAEQESKFAGLSRADSISIDPHKWLYTPVDCGCLMLHDGAAALQAFVSDADYVRVHEQSPRESFAFWDHGIELSRRFRALKVWQTLRYFGARRLSEAIADDIAMANYMAELINDSAEFELLAPVELSICCFRYAPAAIRKRREGNHDQLLNRLNEKIMTRVQRGGRAYLSNAMLHGKFGLRACIINFRTTRADIDLTLEIVRETAKEIETSDGIV